MPAYSRILLPWDRQPQEAVELNPDHPLAQWVVGLWVGSNPGFLAGQVLTAAGTTNSINAEGWATSFGSYAGTGIINLPNTDRFRLVGIDASIVAGVRLETISNNQYPHVWSVRDSGTQHGLLGFGRDASVYSGGRVVVGSQGSNLIGGSGSAKENAHAVYGCKFTSAGRAIYINGSLGASDGVSAQIASNSIQPALGNRQSGGRSLGSGRISFAYFFEGDIGDDWHAELASNPWQIFAPRSIWVPVSAAAGGASTITADAASFTLTGPATGLTASRRLTADAASLALTGTATGLLASRKVTADAASFALTGIAATLKASRLLSAVAASFTLTGNAATLTYTAAGAYNLPADTGAFALTGPATGLAASRLLPADTGIFAFTGSAAGLLKGYTLAADAQAYSLTGNAATLNAARLLSGAAGSFAFTGNAATLTYSAVGQSTLTADAGAFSLTGVAAALTYSGPVVFGSLAGSSRKIGASRRNVQSASRSNQQSSTR